MDGLNDVEAVGLSGDDEVELLERLAGEHQWVALGGQRLPLHSTDVVVQHLQHRGTGTAYAVQRGRV